MLLLDRRVSKVFREAMVLFAFSAARANAAYQKVRFFSYGVTCV